MAVYASPNAKHGSRAFENVVIPTNAARYRWISVVLYPDSRSCLMDHCAPHPNKTHVLLGHRRITP